MGTSRPHKHRRERKCIALVVQVDETRATPGCGKLFASCPLRSADLPSRRTPRVVREQTFNRSY
jgi:hypothetical protein